MNVDAVVAASRDLLDAMKAAQVADAQWKRLDLEASRSRRKLDAAWDRVLDAEQRLLEAVNIPPEETPCAT